MKPKQVDRGEPYNFILKLSYFPSMGNGTFLKYMPFGTAKRGMGKYSMEGILQDEIEIVWYY